ncbi:Rv1733c family protein [Kitasatospora griseola]|uniref:Rv1733c family protein n=1 Tax=Kitasatospora griseola TaxID=2064 RepID=UPI00382FF804
MRAHPRQRNNPLRRGSDRVQWWLARLLLVLALAGLPAALAVGLTVHTAEARAARAQSAGRHPVTARLAEDVPAGPDTGTVPAVVAWTADGTTHRATATVDSGQDAGAPVRIWLDAHGNLVHAPVTAGQATTAAWTAALITATAVPLACALTWKGTVFVLDRCRYARWDAEWQQVEPRWTRRQPS